MSRADLAKNPREVAAMFDDVAVGYDRANTAMTFGMDKRWRHVTTEVLDPQPDERILDLAAGTGVSTVEIGDSGAWAVAADFSLGMLRKGASRGIPMVAADAMRLPFFDDTFDAVAISFGLRNFVDTVGALAEIGRVVRPGGRLVVCEASTPPFGPVRLVHKRVMLPMLTWIGKRASSNPDAYGYLAESIADWPSQDKLAGMIGEAGWRDVEWTNLAFGAVAIHRAVKPS